MDTYFVIAIALAVLSILWWTFKFFFGMWLVGKGCQWLGNQILLQERELDGGDDGGGSSAFSGRVPEGYGTPIDQWQGSSPVRSGGSKGGLTLIKGGRR